MRSIILALAILFSATSLAQQSDPACSQTSKLLVYSDVQHSQETGDVGGIELALQKSSFGTARLYIFEGALLGGPIWVEVKGDGKTFTATGVWDLQLKDEKGNSFTEKHSVIIKAKHDGKTLHGAMIIKGWGEPERQLKLKRVSDLWVCKYGPIV